MVSLSDRLAKVHPNARKKVRDGARYVSAGLSEYTIERDKTGYWFIKKYRGGPLPEKLKGRYTHFKDCENDLIAFLRSKDKFGRAIYPDYG